MPEIMEFASSILDIATRLYECIRNTTYHIRHLEDDMNSLRNEMGTLKRKRDDVNIEVLTAERQPQRRRTEQVGEWLEKVEEVESDVNDVLQQGDEEIQREYCFRTCHRKLWSRHQLGKKASQKLQYVSDMINIADRFSTVAVTLPPPHAQEIPLGTTVGLESNFDKLLRLLRDDDGPGIIGIYGMGGVGKTTLLTKLNNELASQLSDGKFDEVIWVVVSRDLSSVESVQDKIGKKLRFSDDEWRDKSKDEKQAAIFNLLRTKNFVLLLDDIWERIDLHEVGVPLSKNQNKAGRVVFTTRSEEVSGFMEAKKKIQVECLAWQQAWDLFKEKVGEEILNSDHEIEKLARDVCKECDGLPLVLITIGRAMASRTTLKEWETAISMLKISTFRISGMKDEVFRRLKFSYDSLPDDTTRICFLYCALYPEDWNIGVRQLINFWIGEGFLDDECDNIDEASNLAHEIITRLKRACLLLDNEYTGDVNMHDVIRDMALWIVSEKYFVRAGGGSWEKKTELMVAPLFSKWEKAERVFLLNNRIPKLRGTPTCLNLLTLNLSDNSLSNISDSFFECMPALKVLDLSWNKKLKKLPASFFGLFSLQHLDLSYTGILELRTEFKSLIKLKYLYLNYLTENNIIIPPQVISSLLSLKKWEMCRRGIAYEGIELFLDELESLNHLQCLIFAVKTKLELQKLSSLHKLRSCISHLCIKDCTGSSSLQLSSLRNFNRLERLDIRSCYDLEELSMGWEEGERAAVPPRYNNSSWDHIIDAGSGSFHNLRLLTFWNCKVLKDVTWLICVPNLQTLEIYGCDGMEEVIKDADCSSTTNHDHDIGRERSLGVFARLQKLSLYKLPQLKSIYSHPLPFPSLSTVRVIDCPKLNKLPFDSNSGKDTLRSIEGRREWWDKLEWENEETQSVFSPLSKKF